MTTAEPEAKAPVQLQTERLIVRLLTEADVPAVVRFYQRNRAFLAPFEPARPADFFTDEFWKAQVQSNLQEYERGSALRLFVFPRERPSEVIGNVSFGQIVRGVFHACYLGYSLAEHEQGKGYMREALAGSIRYAFDELGLHRVMANYMPHNRRSGAVLRALGFTVEGYARDYLMIAGRWEDHILTSLTNPAWFGAAGPPVAEDRSG